MGLVFSRCINISAVSLISIAVANPIEASPLVPQFRSGEMRINSTSQSTLNETVTSHSYRTGYSYSASGYNIEPSNQGGVINPEATSTTTQTANGISFNWTSPELETIPRWQITTQGAPFSLIENLITPGLDNVTTITRTVETTQTSESISVFGQ